jgi:hypothetical protein
MASIEKETAKGPKWLRAADREWSFQQRMWKIEDVLLKRAETDDAALSYMESFLGVAA